MADAQPTQDDELIDRALQAIDEDELDKADDLLDKAQGSMGENHPRVLHLAGMLEWARDDVERATGYLQQAADLGPDRPEIYLDCAELLFADDALEEAEEQVRAALKLSSIEPVQADEARLLLAQLRLSDNDPDEALEVLDQIDESRKEHPAYLSTRGAVLLADERFDDAVASLEKALEKEEDDPDLHYQLGLALEAAGKPDRAREEMVAVLQLDLKEWEELGEDMPPAPDYSETQELRSRLEDVLEELPDPVLKLVASAPITVQTRANEEQVRTGVNPRSIVAFLGTPKRGNEEAELKGIVILRDLLLAEVSDEDEIEGELFYGLMEELQYFFQRHDLVVAEA
jgi:tetratricopeptide (TPR) repeat protein